MSIELPRAIFFDMDGTLLDWQAGMEEHWRGACGRACPDIGGFDPNALYDAIVVRRDWFWADPENSKAGRMDLDRATRIIVEHAFEDLALSPVDVAHRLAADYRSSRDGAITPYPGAMELLHELQRRGVAMALITNGNALAQRRNVTRFGLTPYFGCIVIEGEFGCGKPDERCFRHALDTLAVEPADAWMVGDNLVADIAPAVALGMHAVWVDESGEGLPPDAAVRPHRVVRSVVELL